MNYTLKPIVYGNQFTIWLRDTFPEWSENDIDDVLDIILGDWDYYTEVYFINNDEDLSLVDEEEREIFANVNRVYAELRNTFCDTDYVSMLVCRGW
jgi:hypothetical protein